jgi:hypothetical protein
MKDDASQEKRLKGMQLPWASCWLSDNNFDRALGYGSL